MWMYFKAYFKASWKKHLHKSGSSLGEISKRLKVPHSSVQTIVRKYKHHVAKQPSYRSKRRHVLSPSVTISAKVGPSPCSGGVRQSTSPVF
jgi:hypothetical protein